MLMGYSLDVAACCWSVGGREGERKLTWRRREWDTARRPLEPAYRPPTRRYRSVVRSYHPPWTTWQ
jgi:hypothetical protein